MKKIIYSIAAIAFTFASCTGDLEDQINGLENELEETQTQLEEQAIDLEEFQNSLTEASIIGDPIKVTHEYSYDANNPIDETYNFGITNNAYAKFNQHSGDIYYVQIQKTNSTSGDIGTFGLYFYYNTATNTVLTYNNDGYNERMYFNLKNKYGDWIYTNAYGSQNNAYQTVDITVSSFDKETGEMSVSATFDYTSNYYYSEYDTDGLVTATFDGVVYGGYEDKPTSSNGSIAVDSSSEAISQLK